MSRKLFWLNSLVVFVALSVLSLESVQAQQCTPGQVLQCDPGGSGAPVDSAITQDPTTGNVGIGTTNPVRLLSIFSANDGAVLRAETRNTAAWSGLEMILGNTASAIQLVIGGDLAFSTGGGERLRITNGGNIGIGTTNPQAKLDVVGTTKTGVLQITGGSDLSEKFEVSHAPSKIEPGLVMTIDPQNPGKLAISTQAYDRRVAGILSGAGGVQPGMLMGQAGTLADGGHPVALTGRVYVWADASNGPIIPGDLLTTSNVPGHAMKVTDHARAQGAIIGKAMTSLPQGRGLVLVLVTLQ